MLLDLLALFLLGCFEHKSSTEHRCRSHIVPGWHNGVCTLTSTVDFSLQITTHPCDTPRIPASNYMGAGARAILPRSQGLGLITSHIPLAKVQSVIWQKPPYNLEMGEYTNFGICFMEEG